MLKCLHNVGEYATIQTKGAKVTLYQCRQLKKNCTQTQAELNQIRLKTAITCENCPKFTPAHEVETDYLTCQNRGEPTRDQLNCNCSIDRTIYQCEIHQRCIKRTPPGRQLKPEVLEGLTICSQCQHPR